MKYKVLVKLRKDFIKADGDTLTVGVMSTPKNGAANKEVVGKIAEYFGVPKSRVKIIAGRASKMKIIEVT